MGSVLTGKPRTLHRRIVSGSFVLLLGSGLTIAINLAYNIVVAQFLGPSGFGQATAIYTLLTLLSAVSLAFQIVASKVVAQQSSQQGKAAVYRAFLQCSWACGIFVGFLLLIFEQAVSSYLNLLDPTLIGLIGIGAAFYVPLGSRRGYIQGTYGFRALAINFVLEGTVRLGGSLILIALGMGIRGVILANSAALVIAYLAIPPKLAAPIPNPLSFASSFRETYQAIVFFSGQMLIGNCGIVLVNHFLPAHTAGLYAAVAMVGRVIFTMTSAVVNTTFPLVAGTHDEERKDLRLIATSLFLVLGSGLVVTLGLCLTPPAAWTMLLGSGFEIEGRYNLSYLLALFALSTIIYSLSAVVITYEMSYKIANTSWVQLGFSAVLVAAICGFHASLREVILVQLFLMMALFICVAAPFLIDLLSDPKEMLICAGSRPLKLIRRVSEDEAVAEFLKSDFHHREFRQYQKTFRPIVFKPNLGDTGENAQRKALLFMRHLSLWNEIPAGTDWFEVEIDESDLGHLRAFPRAQWRKAARGSLSITDVVEGIREHRDSLETEFLWKLEAIGGRLQLEDPGWGAAIFIGLNENEPLTVLDGNHRLVAAMLASPRQLKKLRFVCGLSQRMTECCWYNTNLLTLFQYAWHLMTNTFRRPEAELARFLRVAEMQSSQIQAQTPVSKVPALSFALRDETRNPS